MLRGFLDYRGFTNKSKKHKIYKIRVILFTYEVRVNQEKNEGLNDTRAKTVFKHLLCNLRLCFSLLKNG